MTPNRVTAVAFALAVATAACFVTGHPRLGGLCFLARFFFDCLDGKVARAQGTSSALGATIDLAADVAGIALVVAALGWRLTETGVVDPAVPLALLAALLVHNWLLERRKALAGRLGAGDGGADHSVDSTVPLWRRWVALCRRLDMRPVPWTVEVEIAALGLAPLLLPHEELGWALALAVLFYLVAGIVNLRRTLALSRAADAISGDPAGPPDPTAAAPTGTVASAEPAGSPARPEEHRDV